MTLHITQFSGIGEAPHLRAKVETIEAEQDQAAAPTRLATFDAGT